MSLLRIKVDLEKDCSLLIKKPQLILIQCLLLIIIATKIINKFYNLKLLNRNLIISLNDRWKTKIMRIMKLIKRTINLKRRDLLFHRFKIPKLSHGSKRWVYKPHQILTLFIMIVFYRAKRHLQFNKTERILFKRSIRISIKKFKLS